jgi:hypothetical protein
MSKKTAGVYFRKVFARYREECNSEVKRANIIYGIAETGIKVVGRQVTSLFDNG